MPRAIPEVALSGHIEASSGMSAFGSEADIHGRVTALVSTLLTQSGHDWPLLLRCTALDLFLI
jgi:hypothetical protein